MPYIPYNAKLPSRRAHKGTYTGTRSSVRRQLILPMQLLNYKHSFLQWECSQMTVSQYGSTAALQRSSSNRHLPYLRGIPCIPASTPLVSIYSNILRSSIVLCTQARSLSFCDSLYSQVRCSSPQSAYEKRGRWNTR